MTRALSAAASATVAGRISMFTRAAARVPSGGARPPLGTQETEIDRVLRLAVQMIPLPQVPFLAESCPLQGAKRRVVPRVDIRLDPVEPQDREHVAERQVN